MDKSTLEAINTKLKSDFKLIKQFDSGIANLNYLLESSSGDKIVARVLRDQKPENIGLEFELQKALIASGIKTPLFLTEDDKPIVIKSKDDFITLTKYIGSDQSKAEDIKRSPEFFKEIGLTLAKVQSALLEFPQDKVPPNYLHPDYQKKYKFREEDLSTSEEIKKVISKLYATLHDLDLPKSLIHGDLNDGNYLVDGVNIIAVLDLETTEYNYRLLDISGAIYYTQPKSGLSYPEISELVIEGFENLTKLTEDERQAVPTAVLYNAACFSLWSLANEKGQVSLESNNQEDNTFLKGFTDLQNRIKEGFKS